VKAWTPPRGAAPYFLTAATDWDEAEHPRGHDGKFIGKPEVLKAAEDAGKHFHDFGEHGPTQEQRDYIAAHADELPEVVTPAMLAFHKKLPPAVFAGIKDMPEYNPSASGDRSLIDAAPPAPVLENDFSRPPAVASPNLSSLQSALVDGYTSDKGNRLFNDGLRGKGPAPDAQDVAELDKAIEASEVTRGGTVYRGMSLDRPLAPGDLIADPAYQSVTTDPDVAREFAQFRATGKSENLVSSVLKPNGGHPVVLQMPLGKGSKALRGDSSVKELILPRGTMWRVTRVDAATGLTEVERA
jgi:hypothetical protein